MEYSFSKDAYKELQSLSKATQIRSIKKLIFYLAQKDPMTFAVSIVGGGGKLYRFRVGGYRIIFELTAEGVFCLEGRRPKECV